MKKELLFCFICLITFLFLARGGWFPTDIRLDTGVTPGGSYSYIPTINSDGNNVYVSWTDKRNGSDDTHQDVRKIADTSGQPLRCQFQESPEDFRLDIRHLYLLFCSRYGDEWINRCSLGVL